MKVYKAIIALSVGSLVLTGCLTPSTAYRDEFGGFTMPGQQDVSQMSRSDLHSAIEVAYLDGELTKEQARKAHLQLDVKGHLTAEQVAVINRDRLAKRDAYESQKEQLDVVRDTFGTGTSVFSDIGNMKNAIKDIFN